MKAIVRTTKDVEITHIKLILPILYGDEFIANFPLRIGNVWTATVEIDTGKIENWPDNPGFQQCRLRLKVCDGGVYTLYSGGSVVALKVQDYVPHGVVPGEYGDYVQLDIDKGVITNWPKNPDVSAFFDGENQVMDESKP